MTKDIIRHRRPQLVASDHYSVAPRGASLTWSAATLDRWLSGSPGFVPGVNMQGQVDSKQDRENLIAYLRTLSAATTGGTTGAFGG